MPAPELSNAAIADALEELGDLYELDGAIVHRVLAYRTAAKSVREASVSVAALAREGRASELPGIGSTLQEKILALLETGAIPAAERLRAKFPPGLIAVTRLPGLGPKRARLLHSELGVDSLEKLREAALQQRLRTVRGLGPKLEESVLAALEEGRRRTRPRRACCCPKAIELGEALAAALAERGGAGHPRADRRLGAPAGRQRQGHRPDRRHDPPDGAREEPRQARGDRERRLGRQGGREGAHALGRERRPADRQARAARATCCSTSRAPAGTTRRCARRRCAAGLHVSEYGLLDDAIGRTRTCASEAELYELLGLAYIEPELREDRGELEAARLEGGAGLPRLIELEDIRGDLHSHTIASDGHNTIEEMAGAARERGYEYLAITDHSATHGFGNDVSPEQLRRQIELVHEANASIEGIELLAGSEVNILPDGSLDYEDELLGELDWVIASAHTSFGMGEQAMTERMIAAIEHPLVDAIGHPTGRLIERRAPYAIDLDAVFEAAARTGTMLEINANPDRRDLSDVNARGRARAGVRILIDSDAHRTETLQNMRWGVATARRAWLTREDVVNTRTWPELQQLRKQARK